MIKISKTSKLGCHSWSLQALTTCPAARKQDGSLVDACKGCYARGGNYRFPNVKAPRIHNQEDWKRDGWVDDMVSELDNHRYFRWFDSGDMYHIKLAEKIYQVMKRTQWVSHWLPTRQYKFSKFKDVIERMDQLDNVVVRLSSDSVQGKKVNFSTWRLNSIKTSSTILPKDTDDVFSSDHTGVKIDKSHVVCRAYENDGKCGSCRECWNKDTHTIAYVAHGKSMGKVLKDINELGYARLTMVG